ncbi:unnamed protein product [Penicillium salamii]|uniref:Secreted protein n=1 Tax=Penicillium salamii TaxID=1612424 RepID=A0A9W4JCF6_9EURO|nr:unnamed protein product [Penicillium salamii]
MALVKQTNMLHKTFTIVLLSVLTAAAPVPAKKKPTRNTRNRSLGTKLPSERGGHRDSAQVDEAFPRALGSPPRRLYGGQRLAGPLHSFASGAQRKLAPKLQLPPQLLLPLP